MWFDKTALSYAHWRAGRPAVKNHQLLAGLSTDGFWDIQSFNVIEETLHFYQHSIFACKIEMGKSLSHFSVSNGRTASQGNLREKGFVWACGFRGIWWARHGSRQGRHDGRSRRPAGHWPHTCETSRTQEVEQGRQVSRPTPASHFFQWGLLKEGSTTSPVSAARDISYSNHSSQQEKCGLAPGKQGVKALVPLAGLAPVWRASSHNS